MVNRRKTNRIFNQRIGDETNNICKWLYVNRLEVKSITNNRDDVDIFYN